MADGTQPDEVRVGGRYVLGDMLGRGGMAEVRKGTDVRLGRTVAVKRLRTDLATDPTFQARFRREAQAAAGLNHPNIVSVYDTGEEMAPDGSHVQPYIVMEYVQGRTLREVLNDGRKLLPERALEITSGVLAALDYSHRAGIIHRDIKPANVMLTPAGDVKVMDFGIARAIADGTSTVTQTSAVVGTAQYLSPEQARGETVDSRSDVYSAGCLLYELLTGRPPFIGDSPFSVAYQHVREVADPPRTHNPELPEELDAITMKALAKKVDDRYQSAAEMRADIQRYLDGHPVDAPTALVAAPVVPAAGSETSIFSPPEEEYDEEPRKRRWPLVLGVLVVLGLLVGGIALAVALMSSAEEVSVPDVSDQGLGQARRSLEGAGLTLGSVDREASDVQEGLVIDQDPEPDTLVEEDTAVDLVLSSGPDTTTVPSLIGDSRATAEAELEDRDLVGEFSEADSTEPAGTVIRTDPEAGDEIEVGGTVEVVLSLGPVEVPNVVGRPERRATTILENADFTVEVEEDTETPSERGQVLAQDPGAGSEVARGSTVTITVSRYEEPEPTPTEEPTESPTEEPTEEPTDEPTDEPTETPTDEDEDEEPGAGAPGAPGTGSSPADRGGSEPADDSATEPVAATQRGPAVTNRRGRRHARRTASR
jgi:eukaryotic-like serine/threonine-protein kinase